MSPRGVLCFVPAVALLAGCGLDLDDVRRVSPEELHQALEVGQAVAIDVRSSASYRNRHIKGARWIALEQIEARAGELPRDKLVVTYCS